MTFDRFSLDPVFGWFTLVPVAVLLVASLWLSFASQGISRSGRSVLFLLRLAAMLVLLLGWIRPGFVSEITRDTPGAIAVLMDSSQSMTLPSESQDLSRWEMQQRVWNEIESSTNLELGKTKIVPYFYAEKPTAIDSEDMPALQSAFAKEPTGRITDLGQTLSEISRMQIEPPLRGVILIGDATQTANPAAIEPSLIARQMGQLDQPILMVGLGSRGDQSKVRDIAIEGLPERYSAFAKKELSVRMVVNARGMQNQPIKIEVRLRSSGKPDQVVGSREILASRQSQLIPQEFTIQVPEVGDYLLEAVATVDADDQIPTNNQALSFVTVRDGGAKILCIDGPPRFELRFLRLALDDAIEFDVDYYLISELDRASRGSRPSSIEKEIELTDYDAIMIGDVGADQLSNDAQRIISNHVRSGAGIIFSGGYHSFSAGGYGNSLFSPLFPVELGRGQGQPYDKPIDRRFHVQGNVQVEIRDPHRITSILPEPENSDMWRSLPPLTGLNRVGRLKRDPGVQVLLQSAAGDEVLIKGQYFRGRVLAFTGDSTWRWWRGGQRKICKQFWRQAVLWLISRETLSEGFKLDMETRRLLIDQTPDLRLEWFAGSENKPMPSNIEVELSRDGKAITTLVPTKSGPNSMTAQLSGLSQPGLYKAKLKASGNDSSPYEADIAFVVKDESRELARPDPDWQMMKNLVSANQAAGGKQVMPDAIGDALEFLRNRQEAAQVTSIETRRLGDSAVDSWVYLVAFCLIMSIEWGLRKSWQLP